MKIPKKIVIMGYKFNVKYGTKLPYAGSFDTMKHFILLDKLHPNILEVLMHEMVEIILCLMRCNKDTKGGTRTFTLKHSGAGKDEFTVFCVTLFDTLRRNKLL